MGKQICANSVDPDQMLQHAASDQDPHYLPLIQQFLDTSPDHQAVKLTCGSFRTSIVKS